MRTLLFWLVSFSAIFALSMNVEAIRNDSDLVIYYPFDKDEKEVTDDSGNGFDGEVAGADWSKDGKFGGAMEFDGGSAIKTPQEVPGLTDTESEDEIKADMNDGVLFAVDPAEKLSTTWASIKAEY